ncbi:jacalin-related lectin 3-like [Ananas comosus]|uniref:Jacalin-related lectin 3-like n=1 Tax=Ananas comosus TaxID=4615 RepID=A0A6P5FJ00_ANACO|nr:jacalin-related lectin 3-like [Ananas comosus]
MADIKQGPWGGPKGNSFDTGILAKLLGFKVWHDDDYINGIRFFYEKQTQHIWTPVYGSQVGQVVEVTLGADELFTGIQGTLDWKGGKYVARSLILFTNTSQYGPYGKEQGSTFLLKSTGNIVGFFGLEDDQAINAIGIYTKV